MFIFSLISCTVFYKSKSWNAACWMLTRTKFGFFFLVFYCVLLIVKTVIWILQYPLLCGNAYLFFYFLSSLHCILLYVIRAQLGECLKTIVHADYPEQWPRLLDWVKHNLQDQQVYGALFVLRILSRKYE